MKVGPAPGSSAQQQQQLQQHVSAALSDARKQSEALLQRLNGVSPYLVRLRAAVLALLAVAGALRFPHAHADAHADASFSAGGLNVSELVVPHVVADARRLTAMLLASASATASASASAPAPAPASASASASASQAQAQPERHPVAALLWTQG